MNFTVNFRKLKADVTSQKVAEPISQAGTSGLATKKSGPGVQKFLPKAPLRAPHRTPLSRALRPFSKQVTIEAFEPRGSLGSTASQESCESVRQNDELAAVVLETGLRDRLGICLSTLCLVHCLLTPFILGFLPVGAVMGFWQHGFHQVFLLVVPLVALLAFVPGWRRHRDARVWYWGGVGILLLFAGVGVAEILGHESNGASLLAELLLTGSGGGCLIRAHLLNRSLCACCRHDHDHRHGHQHVH